MSYHVRIESFEGPFDLLLYLVSRQRVDIASISIAEVTQQYLAEVARMQAIDLDVASDFLLVAATLLEIKAKSLILEDSDIDDEEFERLDPHEARELLIERLITYKQFKNASDYLDERGAKEARLHARLCGPSSDLLSAVPDYLEGVSLDELAHLCVQVTSRRDPFLLESDHIAAEPIPVETRAHDMWERIRTSGRLAFSDLLDADADPALAVVTFLAMLELYKRSMIRVQQDTPFGDIVMERLEGASDFFIDKPDSTDDSAAASTDMPQDSEVEKQRAENSEVAHQPIENSDVSQQQTERRPVAAGEYNEGRR